MLHLPLSHKQSFDDDTEMFFGHDIFLIFYFKQERVKNLQVRRHRSRTVCGLCGQFVVISNVIRLGMFFHGMSSLGCERKLFNRLDLLDLFYKFSDRTTLTLYFLHLNTFLSSNTNRTNNIETVKLVL